MIDSQSDLPLQSPSKKVKKISSFQLIMINNRDYLIPIPRENNLDMVKDKANRNDKMISGEIASSTVNAGSLSDLSNLANTSLYGFEDYHGVDIGVVRAVHMWFSPLAGEIPIEIKIKDTDTKLGFAIRRTEEGFIYISSVIEGDVDTPSSISGLSNLYKQAFTASRLIVVCRISNQKSFIGWFLQPVKSGALTPFSSKGIHLLLGLSFGLCGYGCGCGCGCGCKKMIHFELGKNTYLNKVKLFRIYLYF
ncbi:uncharacterized protein Fot_40146 [Forsythia ovata]|uniref:Uncharacterized protein n=1 Tax=Forsythia ovata TaxID=205694 RepID=A0ABD1SA99_9LAMI